MSIRQKIAHFGLSPNRTGQRWPKTSITNRPILSAAALFQVSMSTQGVRVVIMPVLFAVGNSRGHLSICTTVGAQLGQSSRAGNFPLHGIGANPPANKARRMSVALSLVRGM